MKSNTLYNIADIVAENERRKALLASTPYDPVAGIGCCGEREEACGRWVPKMLLAAHPGYRDLDPLAQDRLRVTEDFEYWCVRCVTIKEKNTGRNVPLVLNRPQRRLLAAMESQRMAGLPVRVILLKARQWGGSTLAQMYMAWMQLVRHKGWNSLIVGHKHGSSKNIKQMYNRLLRHYPRDFIEDGAGALRFTKVEGQSNVQQIVSRDCLVITGSSLSEDAARGNDISMAHLSEVAYWKESAMHNPDDVVRSVCGSVTLEPETVIVLESTANGVGDYFHDEWLRAQQGVSDKLPVFVPWHEIDIYTKAVADPLALWQEMDEYEHALWDDGCTLEQINWYHHKRREYRQHELMMAEYPTSDSEAFATSGHNPFPREHLDTLEKDCTFSPVLVGDIQADGQSGERAKRNIHLVKASNGLLKVWDMPERSPLAAVKYMVVVDVGGRSDSSDYTVMAVWQMRSQHHKAAIVAQWRGHIDHDALLWKAMQLAMFYNNALLVVESNTLTNEAARAGESDYILERVSRVYGRVYQRAPSKFGFHTNVKTKNKVVVALIKALRDHSYIERDIEAVNEMRFYEQHNGRYEARRGKHDDILMTRAIGLYLMEDPVVNPDSSMVADRSIAVNTWMTSKVE